MVETPLILRQSPHQFVSIPERVWVWLRRSVTDFKPYSLILVSIPERVWVWLRPSDSILLQFEDVLFQSLRGFGFG